MGLIKVLYIILKLEWDVLNMAYTWKENLVSSSKYSVKCPYSLTPEYITIHDTANSAAAANEISYMISNNNATSFHIAVDESYAIQGVPFNRNAFACGDGANGGGNRKSISIEICRPTNSNRSLYDRAEENAVYVAARLLNQFGLGIDRLKRHQDWSGKKCPNVLIREGRWEGFKGRVQWVLGEIKAGRISAALSSGTTSASGSAPAKPVTSTPAPSKPATSTSLSGSNFLVKIKVAELNIRKSASFDAAVTGTVKKGQVFTITEVKNGLGCLSSGAGWISMGANYVEKVSSAPQSSAYTVKIVNCTVLNVRKGPGTNYAVTGSVKANEVYTIIGEKDGWLQLKSGTGYISAKYTKRV